MEGKASGKARRRDFIRSVARDSTGEADKDPIT